ncbi:MAG: EAL domain-containing protein [Methyloglobulus sp.]|nr:EAL domain-containing protein [Methyloglobulus sp.]
MLKLNKQAAVKVAQLQQLFAASKVSLVTSVFLAIILAYMQREVIALSVVNSWLLIVISVAICRVMLYKAYQRIPMDSVDTINTWLIRFRVGVLVGGVVWGAAGFLMFPAHDTRHQMFLIFMLAGLSAGGVVSLSADLVSSVIFSFATLSPIAIRFFVAGDSLSVAMGMAGILYLGYMVISLRYINQTITDNVVLRFEALIREEAMRINEERYRLLLNHSPVGIFHYDTNLFITYCNEHFADIVHNSIENIVESEMRTVMDKPIVRASINALQGQIVQYDGKYRPTLGDDDLWIEMTCAPSRDVTETIVGGIAIVRDITKSKQAEEMLRINAIAFETQLAMIVTKPNFVILRVNRAFTRLTGYSAQEVIGKTPDILNSGRHDKAFFRFVWKNLKKSGSWQGEVWNQRKNGMIDAEWVAISAVTTPDGRITHYVGTFSDITENKDAMAEIHRLAYYDPLTHLPNRRLLQDRLGQELSASIRNGLHGAILFLDLDNFKALNDTRGHNAGDKLLVEVARRLRSEVRDCDVVGRLGGDEFVVLLEDLSAEADEAAMQAKGVGEKLLDALARPYDFDGYEFHCSTSIGIRLFRDHEAAEELLRHADLAMYQAKTAGRNMLRFFDPAMQTMVTARVEMEKDLRRALEQNQFMLYFQPQVSRDRHVVGAEVLLCWRHPERGFVLPNEFIPLAEKTSLILPIGQWVLETACAQLKVWQAHSQAKHLQLAVNVSARQFRHPDFVVQVRETISSNGIKADLLKLELTESLVLDNISDTLHKMHELRKIGVRFSLDDFGTGYSSFSYLTRLPFDQLKIDRSFVSNIGVKTRDAIIVQTIIGMASNLGIEVIAEGVETEAQYAFLEQHGCPAYQGYLFSRPVQIEKFEQLFLV